MMDILALKFTTSVCFVSFQQTWKWRLGPALPQHLQSLNAKEKKCLGFLEKNMPEILMFKKDNYCSKSGFALNMQILGPTMLARR